MTDLAMDCMGSVILFSLDNDYCRRCPLQQACADKVAENRVHMEAALQHPVFDASGKFWAEAKRTNLQRRAMASKQSTAKPVKPVVTPAPATPAPTPAPAPGGVLSPFEAQSQPGLRKKVAEMLVVWVQRGIDPSQVLAGVNPFTAAVGSKIASLITEVALANSLDLTKKQLVTELERLQIEREGAAWSMASLQSNVNIVAGAYAACGIQIIKETA